jgi:hypothetical protein
MSNLSLFTEKLSYSYLNILPSASQVIFHINDKGTTWWPQCDITYQLFFQELSQHPTTAVSNTAVSLNNVWPWMWRRQIVCLYNVRVGITKNQLLTELRAAVNNSNHIKNTYIYIIIQARNINYCTKYRIYFCNPVFRAQ